tara:strand:+ start:236 stop:451 length:216 start_codon:yes stop_codon:yes gene_type:complete
MTEETNSPVPAKIKHTIMLSPPTSQLVKELSKVKGLSDSELLRGVIERYTESNEFRESLATHLELKTGLTD